MRLSTRTVAAVICATLVGPSLSRSQLKETKIPPGTEVLVGTPAKIPPGLLDSFKNQLSKNNAIKAAYLRLVYYKREGEKPHLALVVSTDSASSSTTATIREELGAASRGFLGQGEYIDIFIDENHLVPLQIAKAVKPFYIRQP